MQESLIQLLRYVRKAWLFRRWAMLTAFATCVAGWTVVCLIDDVYHADTRIYVDTQTMLNRLLSGMTVDSSEIDQEFLRVARRTLLSRPNLRAVARATDLDLTATTPELEERLLSSIAEQVSVRTEGTNLRGQSNEAIVTIGFRDSDPELAAAVVGAFLDVFSESVIGSSRRETSTTQEFLQRQIGEYEQRLEDAEEALKDFKSANMGLLPQDGSDSFNRLQLARRELDDAQLLMRETQRRRDELRAQVEAVQRRFVPDASPASLEDELDNPMREPALTGDPVVDRSFLERRRQGLEERLRELRLAYTDEHPAIRSANRMLADVVAQYDALPAPEALPGGEENAAPVRPLARSSTNNQDLLTELQVELGKLEAEVSSIEERVSTFSGRVQKLESSLLVIPQVEAELRKLTRDYDINRQQYEQLVQRREAARLARSADLVGDQVLFQVIEPPQVPAVPIEPNRLLLLTMVLAGGLGAGAGVGILVSLLRPTFGDGAELRILMDRPLLGAVALIRDNESGRRHMVSYFVYISFLLAIVAVYGTLMAFWMRLLPI